MFCRNDNRYFFFYFRLTWRWRFRSKVIIFVLFTCEIIWCLNWIKWFSGRAKTRPVIPLREQISQSIEGTSKSTFPNLQQPPGRSSFISTTSPTLGTLWDWILPGFKVFCILSRKLSRYSSRHTLFIFPKCIQLFQFFFLFLQESYG